MSKSNCLSIPVRAAIIYALIDKLADEEVKQRGEYAAKSIMMLASYPSSAAIDEIATISEDITTGLFMQYVSESGLSVQACASNIRNTLTANGFDLPEGHMVGKIAAARL